MSTPAARGAAISDDGWSCGSSFFISRFSAYLYITNNNNNMTGKTHSVLDNLLGPLDKNSSSYRFVAKSMGIGGVIIDRLKELGMTEAELCEKALITQNKLNRYYGELHNFTLRQITELEEVLECDLLALARKTSS